MQLTLFNVINARSIMAERNICARICSNKIFIAAWIFYYITSNLSAIFLGKIFGLVNFNELRFEEKTAKICLVIFTATFMGIYNYIAILWS